MPDEPKPFSEFLPELVKVGKAAGFGRALLFALEER